MKAATLSALQINERLPRRIFFLEVERLGRGLLDPEKSKLVAKMNTE